MIKNIYVFGAGASYNTHPIIRDFFDSIQEALSTADSMPFEEFESLVKKIQKEYKTPDAYAKYLFSLPKGHLHKDYLKIKNLYNTWVDYYSASDWHPGVVEIMSERGSKHIGKEKQTRIGDDGLVVDERYIKLLKKLKSKSSSNLLYTWNYDLSLELTCEELQAKSLLKKIVHLNGNASKPYSDEHNIKFYWENPTGAQKVPKAKKYIFIGYSFPEDNFEQDVEFFQSAYKANAKIYIQNPTPPESEVNRILSQAGINKNLISISYEQQTTKFMDCSYL